MLSRIFPTLSRVFKHTLVCEIESQKLILRSSLEKFRKQIPRALGIRVTYVNCKCNEIRTFFPLSVVVGVGENIFGCVINLIDHSV